MKEIQRIRSADRHCSPVGGPWHTLGSRARPCNPPRRHVSTPFLSLSLKMPLTRPGQLNLAPILSAQPPTIDLHLPAYEASTRNFLQAIADFNSRAIAEINQRREAHSTEMNRLAERAQNMEKETNQCKIKEIELIGGSYRARPTLALNL